MSLIVMASLKGSVLLLAAWAAARAFRRGSAAARHLIWVSALAGMLVMPVLSALVPAMRLPALPQLSVSASTPAAASPTVEETAAQAPRVRAPEALQAGVPDTSHRPIDVTRYLPALWLLGAALILLRLALGTMRVSSWSRRARVVDDGLWLALVQRLAGRLGIGRPVILLCSERSSVPMTWGIVYPTVLLPVEADDWTDERRTIVLLHELAHVKRFDAFTQLVAHVATALFWFNPLVWIAARQMRREREHACDDFVLAAGARASDYANDLLQIARSLGGSSAPAAAALAMARRGELEGRLLAILDPHTNRRSVSRARLVVATFAVIVLALPLAALTPAETAAVPSVARRLPSVVRERRSLVAVAPRDDNYSQPATRTDHALEPAPRKEAILRAFQSQPDRETLVSVARAASKMTSDYEKAELLVMIAKYYIRDDELRTIYLDAVSSMTSDYHRSRALMPLLVKDALPPSAVAQVVRIASSMTSDNEKAAVIVKVATDNPDLTDAMRTALISSTRSMTSDYDRSRSLRAIARRGGLSDADLLGLINSAGDMTSSYEAANSLVEISSHYALTDAAVRKAYFKAVESISGSSDYRRALAGVLK